MYGEKRLAESSDSATVISSVSVTVAASVSAHTQS